tara:strand:+ start:1747 stop:1905 length:159 start_codon:yes stop_codon:yes gene_type:complete
MSEKRDKELQKLIDEIIKVAKDVVVDYKNSPVSGSKKVIQVHENSPLLKDNQ